MSNHVNDSTVVLAYENIQITLDDLECLKPRKYINDKIINFYLKFMHKTLLNHEQQQKVHIFDSFFADALDHMDDERAVRWLRRVNIFEKDFLLIPVNIDEHWFLMIICYPINITTTQYPLQKRPRILTMDSMPYHTIEKKQQMIQYLRVFIRCASVVQKNMTEQEISRSSICMQNIDVNVEEQVIHFHSIQIVFIFLISLLFILISE